MSTSTSAIGSASKKRQIFYTLTQIVGIFNEDNEPIRKVKLLVTDIANFIFSPVVLQSSLTCLEGLTVEFLTIVCRRIWNFKCDFQIPVQQTFTAKVNV
jgi:hypothetical protein